MNKYFELLQIKLGSGILNNDTAKFFCPKHSHHKRKLIVNFKKQVFHCWVCGYSGRLIDLFNNLQINRKKENLNFKISFNNFPTKKSVLHLPKSYIPLYIQKNKKFYRRSAMNYLLTRNLSEFDIEFFKIGYTEEDNENSNLNFRIIIPSFDNNSQLNYWIGRNYYKSDFKYYNPSIEKSDIIFNEIYIDWDEEIILTEGFFDYAQLGTNSIPLLGNSLSEHSKIFKMFQLYKISKVIIALDNTYDALILRKRIATLLLNQGISVYFTELPNNIKDFGMLTKKQCKEIIKKSYEISKLKLLTIQLPTIKKDLGFKKELITY